MRTVRPIQAGSIALLILASSLVALFVTGCGQKEEPPPSGSSYYTGPMQSKAGAEKAKAVNTGNN